jgi:hypothetical protein
MSDDKVIDRSNLFILVIHDVAADQFAGPVALRNGTDINDEEFHMCTVTRAGDQAATYASVNCLGGPYLSQGSIIALHIGHSAVYVAYVLSFLQVGVIGPTITRCSTISIVAIMFF